MCIREREGRAVPTSILVLALLLSSACARGSPGVDVQAAPEGTWARSMCQRAWMNEQTYRRSCLRGVGEPAIALTVHNGEDRTVAFASCHVDARDASGSSIGAVDVPVNFTHGEPFDAARLDGGRTLTFNWYVPVSSHAPIADLEATCPASFDAGPYPS